MSLKIAIVVHGRFHAFDLARELLHRGHDVTLLTNYPRWAVERFGVPGDCVRSFWLHGVASRVIRWLNVKLGSPPGEAVLHTAFGRWAAAQVTKERWDVVHCWSGVSEELLRALKGTGNLSLLMRGSAHIRTQARLLEEEGKRTGAWIDCPSPWIIAREEREYALADQIAVLSRFAYRSFLEEGILPERLRLLPLGSEVKLFRPGSEVVEERVKRILSGDPLRVLYVGAVSFRKGMWDMVEILQKTQGGPFRFRLVGAATAEVKPLMRELTSLAEGIPSQPQRELPRWYAWADLFLFPTIEDGYPMVLAQAQASALPILTTTNCSGPDILQEGKTGWVLPIRNSEAFVERLRWCDTHRETLAAMARHLYEEFRPREWAEVAADFETICQEYLSP